MAEQAGEKKHEATPYRRQQARQQGRFARSQDLGSALLLLAAVGLLWWSGPQVGSALAERMTSGFSQDRYWDLDPRSAAGLVSAHVLHCLGALAPMLIGVCLVILLNGWGQGGIHFLPDKLAIDL